MTVYVDDMRVSATVGRITSRWSHLFSDTSIEELEEFASKLGLNPSWIQRGEFVHYDLTDNMRARALRLGAENISWRNLATMLEQSHMRIPPHNSGSNETR